MERDGIKDVFLEVFLPLFCDFPLMELLVEEMRLFRMGMKLF